MGEREERRAHKAMPEAGGEREDCVWVGGWGRGGGGEGSASRGGKPLLPCLVACVFCRARGDIPTRPRQRGTLSLSQAPLAWLSGAVWLACLVLAYSVGPSFPRPIHTPLPPRFSPSLVDVPRPESHAPSPPSLLVTRQTLCLAARTQTLTNI